MSTLSIDDTTRGQSIATDGTLTGITLTETPTDKADRETFCLVDTTDDGDVVLFNLLLYTNTMGRALMTAANIPFTNLVVQGIPAGATFDLEYT
jgi:hypothetical protein